MSHCNPVEALESRTLLTGTPLDWPFQPPGVRRVGRTLYIAGTDSNDQIRIDKPASATDAKRKIQVVLNDFKVNNAVPLLVASPLRKVLINGAGGDDSIIIATGLTNAFHPKLIVIRGGAGNDTITGGDKGERILGETGNDTIDGGAGNDEIDGGDGNDTITGGAGRDVLKGGTGDDTFKNLEPADQRPTDNPGAAHDILVGGPGTDNCQADPVDKISNDIENKNA